MSPKINRRELAAALARRGWRQWRLAAALGRSPSALSAYLTGTRPVPQNLMERMERLLRVPAGALIATQ
ncbi:MAG: helix-turn-helix domain-containing protein [Myxococcaceae bacterium]